jgi:hypothetical protein
VLPELIEQKEEMAGTFDISLIKDCLLKNNKDKGKEFLNFKFSHLKGARA